MQYLEEIHLWTVKNKMDCTTMIHVIILKRLEEFVLKLTLIMMNKVLQLQLNIVVDALQGQNPY